MRQTRYSNVAVLFHWTIAALLIFNLFLGFRMEFATGLAKFNIFQLHKSFGLTILVLSVLRLGWRLYRPPPHPESPKSWERVASQVVHWSLYVAMIGLPLSGWVLVSASPLNIPTLLFHRLPWPYFPGVHTLPAPAKAAVDGSADATHVTLVFGTLFLLALHVGAVIKHHALDRDPILGRMLPSPFRLSRPA